MKELQVLLAQRLLAINDDNIEKVEKEVTSPFLYCDVVPVLIHLAAKEYRDFENPLRGGGVAGL